jgi:hypothetical protein
LELRLPDIIMDPLTIAALLGLAGKALAAGVEAWKAWLENGRGGVAVASDGTQYALPADDERFGPDLSEPSFLGSGEPVSFEGVFVLADPWAATYLAPEQPVLLVIEDRAKQRSFDSLVAITSVGSRLEGSLFPGNYRLGAFVFLDDDPDNWDDADGGALVDFSVAADEAPIRLEIPIEAIQEPAEIFGADETPLADVGYLREGERDNYDVIFEGDVMYRIYLSSSDPTADFDLYVYDESDELVDQDDEPASDALCSVTPRSTGPFQIAVECSSGQSPYRILVQEVTGLESS